MSCSIGHRGSSKKTCCCGFLDENCFYDNTGNCPNFSDIKEAHKHIEYINFDILKND